MNGHILFGRSTLRREILGRFFSRPGLRAHVRELARQIGHAPSAVGPELDLTSPVVKELRPLVQRTAGAEALLQQAFEGLEGIEEAFIYGSHGTAGETPGRDIDGLVIGHPTERMWERVVAVERKLGREISVKHYSRAEIERLQRARSEFVRSAYAGRRVMLVGGAP